MEMIDADVHVGAGVVVVRRKGSSAAAIAAVLGSVSIEGGKVLYLDRLVHKPWEATLGGYAVKGAISSIITIATPESP